MPAVSRRTRAGTFSKFVERYLPIYLGTDELLRPWDDPDILKANAEYVWTAVEAEGKIYLMPGFATVNYVGRVLCQKPYGLIEAGNPGYLW